MTGLIGERPRESHGFDFETGDEIGEGGSFAVYMYGVTGTVEMDGLAVMEMGPVKPKDGKEQSGVCAIAFCDENR